jgi:hypothetical protein
MDLTKEEILKDCKIESERLQQEKPMLHHNILKAMEKYAEQESKAFANWMSQQVNHDLRMSDFWKKFRQEVS